MDKKPTTLLKGLRLWIGLTIVLYVVCVGLLIALPSRWQNLSTGEAFYGPAITLAAAWVIGLAVLAIRDGTRLFMGFALLLLAACSAGLAYHPTKVKDTSDLSEFSGHLHSYSFRHNRNLHHYVIWFSEYPTAFQVPGDASLFSRARFESDLHKGDALWASIPKVSQTNLASDKPILIFSLRTRTATYLDEKGAIQSYNSHMGIWMSVVFLLAGVVFLIWPTKLRLTPRPNPRPPPLPFLE